MNTSRLLRGIFKSAFSCFCSNVQVIPSGGSNLVQMCSTILYDPLNELDAVTHTFTPVNAGWYLFHASVAIQGLAIADYNQVRLFQNLVQQATKRYALVIVGDNPASVTRLLYVLPTDTVHVEVTHNFGANRNIFNGVTMTRFEGFRIG